MNSTPMCGDMGVFDKNVPILWELDKSRKKHHSADFSATSYQHISFGERFPSLHT